MTALIAAWTFAKSPIGRYALLALGCVALVFGFAAHERHVQHASDLIHEQKAVAAVQASLDTCHANVSGLQASVAAQNAAVEAVRAEGDRRAKMLADGLQQARAGRAGVEKAAAGLLAHPAVGVDACARSEAARDAVLRSLP
jgi:hypothetical protein